jgi:hypothetical protein
MEGQTMQWLKKSQKEKQLSTKHCTEPNFITLLIMKYDHFVLVIMQMVKLGTVMTSHIIMNIEIDVLLLKA